MTPVEAIIERLRDASETPFALVERIGDLAALKERPNAMPAAYVLTMEEVSGDNERDTGPVLQRIESDIGVIIVAENVSDAKAGAAAAEIEEVKAWTRRRLLGFVPDAATGEPVTHVAGKLVKVSGGCVWWGETFGLASFITEEEVP